MTINHLLFGLGGLLFSYSAKGQDLYDLNEIQTIEITMAESNWDQLLDNAYPSGEYILAQSVSINGEVFDSVGVKYKGNSTYQSNQTKNPWHIELDTYKDHIYEAYTDIKLSNIAKDPSFLREVLSYQILRQYMDAPLSNYANLYVNGELIGLYSSSEAVSKKFVDSRFGSKNNTFVKCNPPDGAGPQSSAYPDLRYLGADSTAYYDSYEIKSDDGWDELINLCDTLNNSVDAIEQILDVDRALWMLAFNNALVNLDSYIGGFKQNYYLYRDDYGRFLPVVWDLNESFGKFAMTGSGNLNTTNAKISMDPLLHENDSDFPLMSQLMDVPRYKRMYIAHYKTILEENFTNDTYYTTATELKQLIDEAVQADPNKLFSYSNFLTNLDSDIGGTGGGGGGGGGSTPGIAPLMDGRADYLLALPIFTATAPTVGDVSSTPAQTVVGETAAISASVEAADAVFLQYRTEEGAPFTNVEMFDDGASGDGQAGDGVYGTEITVPAVLTEYYIYAENDDAGIFSPQRAEHEFFTLISTTSSIVLGDLVINEFMASNDVTMADQDGEFDDWIELYNNGDESIDLTGFMLSDDPSEPAKFIFPSEASIPAGDYLMIWADGDTEQVGLHADFKLSASGESVILSDADGMVLDEVTFTEQSTDISYGRFPNGTGDFQTMVPTFAAMNSDVTSTNETEATNAIKVFPNPIGTYFTVVNTDPSTYGKKGSVYTLEGRLVGQFTVSSEVAIDATNWQSGIYIVRIQDTSVKVVRL